MRVFQKTISLFVLACASILISACGDSDSSSSDDLEEGDLPSQNIDVDSKVSDAAYFKDRFYNSSTGSYVNTIQFGMYIWLEDNSTETTSFSSSSVCYDNVPENCYIYGRLYSPGASRCPSGFTVPTKEDWSRTMSYLDRYDEMDSIFGFSKGGSCYERQGDISCSGLGKTGYYLAKDSAVAEVSGHSVSFSTSSESGFYQLRCVKYTYIVATENDLPHCDTTNQYSLNLYYVMSKKSNFRCIGSRWVDDFSDNCGHVDDDMFGVYNDSMYICKSNRWQLASISDSKETCTENKEGTTFLFNGKYYACEDERWREFTKAETYLGYCNEKKRGTLDSVPTVYKAYSYEESGDSRKVVYTHYFCDSLGWREAGLADFFGKCDSTKVGKTAYFEGADYVCRGKKWEEFTDEELEFGVCTSKTQGKFDTTWTGDSYICDDNAWRVATKNDYLGECTPEREDDVVVYNSTYYICQDEYWDEVEGMGSRLGLCTAQRQGERDTVSMRYDAGVKVVYICDSSSWRELTPKDVDGECTNDKLNKVIQVGFKKWYCYHESWYKMDDVEEEYGLCFRDDYGKEVTLKGSRYVCQRQGWRELTKVERTLGVCTDSIEGKVEVVGDSTYMCHSYEWVLKSRREILGDCDESVYGKTGSYSGVTYVCREDGWDVTSALDESLGICSPLNAGELKSSGTTDYRCEEDGWTLVDANIANLGECTSDTVVMKKVGGVYYYCKDHEWNVADSIEQVYGECTDRRKLTAMYKDTLYYCNDVAFSGKGWMLYDDVDMSKGYCASDTLTFKGVHYKCKSNRWNKASIREYMGTCTSDREGHVMYNGIDSSVCTEGKWVARPFKTMTDSRDGKKYDIADFDGVTWMVQNLNYNDASDSTECVDEDEVNCGERGRLYSLSSAKKVCPTGWHLPDSTEWRTMNTYAVTLYYYVGSTPFIDVNGVKENYLGLEMAPTGLKISYLRNGFDAAVMRYYESLGAYYWNAEGTVWSFGYAYEDNKSTSGQVQNEKAIGVAVRCVKN
ncbi:FISUMP domain-containing protein [Fibrobacter sp.]|uniref:FISUMP domain-containing protein n=1 Tax=Fibrobacter sp. TaxID=35828 RepID=UPI00386BE579